MYRILTRREKKTSTQRKRAKREKTHEARNDNTDDINSNGKMSGVREKRWRKSNATTKNGCK